MNDHWYIVNFQQRLVW